MNESGDSGCWSLLGYILLGGFAVNLFRWAYRLLSLIGRGTRGTVSHPEYGPHPLNQDGSLPIKYHPALGSKRVFKNYVWSKRNGQSKKRPITAEEIYGDPHTHED